MSRLDWHDPAAVVLWLAGLRASFADADAAALDMLKPPRSRELGPALHAQHYQSARAQVLQALDYAEPREPEPSDPAGCGGSPAL